MKLNLKIILKMAWIRLIKMLLKKIDLKMSLKKLILNSIKIYDVKCYWNNYI